MSYIAWEVHQRWSQTKIMTTIEGEEWIIKFPAHVDGRNAGKDGI